MIKRFVLALFLILAIFNCCIKSAVAISMSFADYVYQNARYGRVDNIHHYLSRCYNIDAVNYDGLTALCLAVQRKDFRAYRRLIQLGAFPHHQCMDRVDVAEMQQAENRATLQASSTSGAKAGSQLKRSDNTMAYAGLGLLTAGGVAAIALSHGGHHSSSNSVVCPSGQHLVDGECVDIVCPEGQHLVGDVCVPDDPEPHECPVGQRYVDGKCVDIECPENTHLVGNLCVADDIDETTEGDDDVYGIYSDKEAIFNIYSSPKYPDDSASIQLHNTGNGDVYGMYGYGGDTEVFNIYMVGRSDSGDINPKPEGVANISITDVGSGNVYGMYSHISDITQYKEAINASGWNDGIATGNININHTGGGDSYGILGDVRAYNAFVANNGRAYGNINITGDGDMYGINGYVAATNVVNYWFGNYGEGNINLNHIGDGNVYGMKINKGDIPGAGGTGQGWFAFNAYVGLGGDAKAIVDIHNVGNGNVYGMYGGEQLYNAKSFAGKDEESNPTGHPEGIINIVNIGNGDSYGMYIPDADEKGLISNESENGSRSVINIVNIGSGQATGIRGGEKTTIVNSGEININNLYNGTAIGIYAEKNANVTNTGTIIINRSAYNDKGTVYNPSGFLSGTAYGIYAESGAAIENHGTIDVSGAAAGRGVYLQTGATLVNTGTIRFNGEEQDAGVGVNTEAINFNDLGGGEVVLGQGGQFFASKMIGDLGVSYDVVTGNFENSYMLYGALQSNDISELNTISKSAMFDAKAEQNSTGGYDVVLERKNFNSLVNDASVAQFLESNYKEGNNLALYDNLKTAATTQAVNHGVINYVGNDILPSFRRENALVYSQLSRQFNDSLFNRPDEHYFGGYKYIDISRDRDGNLVGNDGTAHAAYGMVKGKADNGVVYGLGATVAQLKSDYDNHSKRKSNLFGLWAPVGYDFGNTHWRSKLYAGYEDGEYDRVTATNKFSSDINSYQYGLSNEVRHNIALGGGIKLTPAAELNLLGIYQDGFDEGSQTGAVHSDSTNSLSLEGGIGAYLSKDFVFDQDNRLGIQIGGIYYVEFLDPDDGMDAHINGMSGKYKIYHKYDDDRAILSARVNYDYRNMTLYGLIEQETGGAKALVINAGLQYNL